MSAKLSGIFVFSSFLLFAALLFYIVLGLKNLYFVSREAWHYIYLLGIFILLFVLFFSADRSQFFFLKTGGVFVVHFFLWKEFFKNNIHEVDFRGKRDTTISLISAIIAFSVTEMAWITILLPLGILQSMNLLLLFIFVLSDTIIKYIKQLLSRRLALVNVTIFVLFTILIFAVA